MIRGIAMKTYLTLCAVAILPVIVAVFLYYLDKNTAFGNARNITKQIIYGIIFGILAILGTECGVPLNGAQINCRDACVLIAGLMFGAPAGIIAGVIGAAERWIAVAWGVGTFTRVACTVSTLIAGFYAAARRKHMFEDKKPGWFISLAIGVVMEVFHITMIFITNMNEPDRAIAVVQSCSAPMIIANGASVMVAAILLFVVSLALVVLVVVQTNRGSRSQAISGSASSGFAGKNSGNEKEKFLVRSTIIAAIIFAVLVVAVNIIETL